jgi:hypothetical protein
VRHLDTLVGTRPGTIGAVQAGVSSDEEPV